MFIFHSDIRSWISVVNLTALESVPIGSLHAGHPFSSIPSSVKHTRQIVMPLPGLQRWAHLCYITCQPVLLLPVHPHWWSVNWGKSCILFISRIFNWVFSFLILAQLNYVDWLNKWINVTLIPGTWPCRFTKEPVKEKPEDKARKTSSSLESGVNQVHTFLNC